MAVGFWFEGAFFSEQDKPSRSVEENKPIPESGRFVCMSFSLLLLSEIFIGFNPHTDFPVEPLHTILLGVIKYAWYMTHSRISNDGQLDTLQARLQSIDTDGMNIGPVRASYIIQYRNSLIGRQFKAIIQTISFVLYDLVDDQFRDMWTAAGHMTSLMWYPEIENIDTYCVRFQCSYADQ